MLLLDGKSTKDAAYLVQTKRQDATIVKRELEAEGKLDMTKVKKELASNLSAFVLRATERLKEEVDTMPIGRLTLDAAIAIDKLRDLTDSQQVVIEKKIIVTQDDINNILSLETHIKTIEKKSLDETKIEE